MTQICRDAGYFFPVLYPHNEFKSRPRFVNRANFYIDKTRLKPKVPNLVFIQVSGNFRGFLSQPQANTIVVGVLPQKGIPLGHGIDNKQWLVPYGNHHATVLVTGLRNLATPPR